MATTARQAPELALGQKLADLLSLLVSEVREIFEGERACGSGRRLSWSSGPPGCSARRRCCPYRPWQCSPYRL